MSTALLVGTPNSGKSTIFNGLSGEYRKVSNYSGITVDAGIAELKSNRTHQTKISVVDLPGINSLIPSSLDEGVTLLALMGKNPEIATYKMVYVVLDWTRIENTLALILQLKDALGSASVALVINKVDNREIFTEAKSRELSEALGVAVFSGSALKGDIVRLDYFIRQTMEQKEGHDHNNSHFQVSERSLEFLPTLKKDESSEVLNESELLQKVEGYHREARKILNKVLGSGIENKITRTEKIDKLAMHPILGIFVFLAVFYLLFHAIYTWASPLADGLDSLIVMLSNYLGGILPDGMLKSFVIDGVIAGVGGVIVFLPQIMILFFLLSFLEQSGYIARAAFVTDKFMNIFGLNGKAFLPYLSGFACSIPAIMAARTIPNKKERLATILTIPMITCSARLPVYVLLIGTFVPKQTVMGIFDSQALSFFFLYFLGSFFALIMAKVFRLSLFKGNTDSFFIDLPLYQAPSLMIAVKQMLMKAKVFLKKAGTVILFISVLIWILSTFPKASPELLQGKSDEEVAAISLENSVMGRVGKTIEPLIAPIGMNWKMGIGILASFGARELFVSTLGTIYSLGEVDEESEGLRERLQKEIDPITGKPIYSLAVAWSLLIFFVFSLQCTSTWVIARRETGSWKYPIGMFLYMGTLGYLGSFAAYHFLK